MDAAPAQLTIVDDYDSITVRPVPVHSGHPVTCRTYEIGAPEIRDASTPRIGQDGVYDDSAFTGARPVSLDLVIRGDGSGSPYSYLERLVAFAHPGRRPYLYMSRYGVTPDGPWRMRLRGNPFSITHSRRAAALLELGLAFTSPTGYFESPQKSLGTSPTGAQDTDWSFPMSFPYTFGSSGITPSLTFDVVGSAPVSPIITIYGPAVNPELVADDGTLFAFNGLTLDVNQHVYIDMGVGAVNLNADPTSSVWHLVDWGRSRWFRLMTGTRRITIRGITGAATVYWRNRRLTI